MKKYIFILLLMVSSLGFAQSNEPFNEPFIDPALSETFQSLIQRAQAHGKDYSALLKEDGLVSIKVVDSLPEGLIGHYKRTGATFIVQIPKSSLNDSISLEWTLAHELGHGLGLECITKYLADGKTRAWGTDIMYGDGVTDPTHIIYQIMNSPQYSPEIWANYFNSL